MSFISRCFNVFVLFYCTYIYGVPGDDPTPRYQNMEQSENKRRSMTVNSEPIACRFCNRVFFDKVSLLFHFEMHIENEPNAQNQHMGQSENKRSVATDSMPIACRVCNKIFFDNVSLVFHFESHLKKETPDPGQSISTLASLQHDSPVSLNSSRAASSEERVSVTHRNKIPRTTDYSRPSSFSVCSSNAPIVSLRDFSSVQAPVLNLNVPLISSFYAPWGASQSSLLSTESPKTVSSLFSQPLSSFQFAACRVDYDWAAGPSNKQNGGENYSIKQLVKPSKEIIIISDDEEDEPKSDVEILDLTLKL